MVVESSPGSIVPPHWPQTSFLSCLQYMVDDSAAAADKIQHLVAFPETLSIELEYTLPLCFLFLSLSLSHLSFPSSAFYIHTQTLTFTD